MPTQRGPVPRQPVGFTPRLITRNGCLESWPVGRMSHQDQCGPPDCHLEVTTEGSDVGDSWSLERGG